MKYYCILCKPYREVKIKELIESYVVLEEEHIHTPELKHMWPGWNRIIHKVYVIDELKAALFMLR